uniref:Putative F-box/FBD/LRR-repeat protein n=1 Tax=Noccaea caerulescens TaxID=107243 RepID=A0A1J3D4D9_NOCCA
MRYDRISALPDSLISQILLYLPTKDSVKTSVLSKRWRNLWLDVPGLELHSNDFPLYAKSDIKTFTDKFLKCNRELSLQKFKIKYDECNVYLFGISEWFATAINRGAQVLDVDTCWRPYYKDFMPLEIYNSKTLVSLKLVNVGMPNPPGGLVVVSLPCLKRMHLEDVLYSDEDPLIMEKLISGCPVLEDLTVCRVFDDNVPVLRVRSQSVKRFCVKCGGVWKYTAGKEYAVEIDAPGLEYMNFSDGHSGRVVAKNLTSLFMVDIDSGFNVFLGGNVTMERKGIVRDFFTGVSSVRHMIISQHTLQALYRFLKLGTISVFQNLSRLEASFCTFLLQVLPGFLENFPNLKHLTVYLVHTNVPDPDNLEPTVVPRCLLSTLECVEIKEVITEKEAVWNRTLSKRTATRLLKVKKSHWMKAVSDNS